MIGWYYIIIVIQSNLMYMLIDQFVTDTADLLQIYPTSMGSSLKLWIVSCLHTSTFL